MYLDGEYYGNTQKTHYTFLNLQVKQAYQVCVEAYLSGELKAVKNYEFKTKQAKKRLDVTKPPYNAVGDGKTLNTKALQMKTIYVRTKVGYNNDGEAAKTLPVLENYSYENVTLYGRIEEGRHDYIYLAGYEEPNNRLRNVFF